MPKLSLPLEKLLQMDFLRMNYAVPLNGAEHSQAWKALNPEEQDEYNVLYKELYAVWSSVKLMPEWTPGKDGVKSFIEYAEKNPVSEEIQSLFKDLVFKS